MFGTVVTIKSDQFAEAFLQCHCGFSPALRQRLGVLMLLLAAALITTSCGGVSGSQNNGNVQVAVSPTSETLSSKQTQQFTATISGSSNTGVTWSATEGSVNGNGLYTAPAVTAQTNAVVTATSVADSSKSASAAVTVTPAGNQALTITTGSLPLGQQGSTYNEVFAATGGTTPYSWSISAGTPPPGTTMTASGDFAGSPTAAGAFNFTVRVTDATRTTATGNFSVTVVAGGSFDGPAELPLATVPFLMSDTPAPGTVTTVNAGGDVQSALNNAQCGDIIELQAGATFTSLLTLPAKQCDDQHWIIIRTSAPDSALPPEGQRLTPCYAGLASLPNRPAYSCSQPQNVLATISRSVVMGEGPIIFASGANHYRLLGLEITRPVDKVPVVALVAPTKDAPADHIVIDRCWIHGTAQDETRRGVFISGTTNVAIVDSYLNDFHCEALYGTCTDSQAISGGTGDNAGGPWDIENNFLEAAGENILFGGAAATVVPADITIRYNHFYKVPQWWKNAPGFVGGYHGYPFLVKNLFEIKNGSRILFEGNLLEHSWGGFTQTGYAILLTPRNQRTKEDTYVCPLCEVTDVTIRYVRISHVGSGMTLATAKEAGGGPSQALAGTRWSIHDVVIDDISKEYAGFGNGFMILNGWPTNPLNTVTINHVTAFPDPQGTMILTGNADTNPPMYGLVFTNNLMTAGAPPVADAQAGKANCAHTNVPLTTIATCFTTYTFTNSVLIASPSAYPPDKWPSGNFFPATTNDVGFVNYNNGNGGNYQLQPGSPYKGKASDGTDPGADINAVNAAIQGVE